MSISYEGGKLYNTVPERLRAFREDYPASDGWAIIEELVEYDPTVHVVIKAAIIDPTGRVVAVGHAHETPESGLFNKHSMIEVACTSAQGRALAAFGYFSVSFASDDEIEAAKKRQKAASTPVAAKNAGKKKGKPKASGTAPSDETAAAPAKKKRGRPKKKTTSTPPAAEQPTAEAEISVGELRDRICDAGSFRELLDAYNEARLHSWKFGDWEEECKRAGDKFRALREIDDDVVSAEALKAAMRDEKEALAHA